MPEPLFSTDENNTKVETKKCPAPQPDFFLQNTHEDF
jgi:hypothetical protein